MRLTPLDLAIIAPYLIGVSVRHRIPPGPAYGPGLFSGRPHGALVGLGVSIVATETSTLTIIGTPALAFAGNLTFLQLVLGYLAAAS